MGCLVSKGYPATGKEHFHKTFVPPVFSIEYDPDFDNKKNKKKIAEITRQSRIISDPLVTEKYEVQSIVGSGSFGDVFRAEEIKTKLPFAIKGVELRSFQTQKTFQNESNVFEQLKDPTRISHPYIVQLKEIIHSKLSAYIVMELATGGDLLERIKSSGHIAEKESLRITRMLLSGVSYLHDNGIVHRDLKPENVLFYKPGQNSKIIITDFGLASSCSSNPDLVMSTYCGTLQYLSPEMIQGFTYTNKVDIWAVGVIVYAMLSGNMPFHHTDETKIRDNVLNNMHSYEKKVWTTVSEDAKDFINGLLRKKEADRCDVKKASQHKWCRTLADAKKEKGRSHTPNSNSSDCSTPSGKLTQRAKQDRSFVAHFDKIPLAGVDEQVADSANQPSHSRKDKNTQSVNAQSLCRSPSRKNSLPQSHSPDTPSTPETNNRRVMVKSQSLEPICSSRENDGYANYNSKEVVGCRKSISFGSRDEYEQQFVIPWSSSDQPPIRVEDLFSVDASSSTSTTGEFDAGAGSSRISSTAVDFSPVRMSNPTNGQSYGRKEKNIPIPRRSLSHEPSMSFKLPSLTGKSSLFQESTTSDNLFANRSKNLEKIDRMFCVQSTTMTAPVPIRNQSDLPDLASNQSVKVNTWLAETMKKERLAMSIRNDLLEALSKSF